jgi:hypothetical protein
MHMHTYDKSLWQSISAARYDFGAVGAALFSAVGLAASITASAHVVGSLFNASYEATAYGVALFLLAEGVAYYIEVYALFEGRLRWWLWLLRWVGPLLSAAAGGLAAYGWLPPAYKGFALVTTVVVPLFQWGFLSLLMDRIRAVHSRRMALESQESTPAPEQQLLTMYRAIQHQRSLDDLKRLEAMIVQDAAQPALALPRQPAYPTPVRVNDEPEWFREMRNAVNDQQDDTMTQQQATQPHSSDGTQQEAIAESVSVPEAIHEPFVCPNCGASLESHGKLMAARRWGYCKACKS